MRGEGNLEQAFKRKILSSWWFAVNREVRSESESQECAVKSSRWFHRWFWLIWSLSIVKAIVYYTCCESSHCRQFGGCWVEQLQRAPSPEKVLPPSWAEVTLLTCVCPWRGACRVCNKCRATSWLWKIGVRGGPMRSISELALVDKHFPISLFYYLLPALTSDTFAFISLVLSEQPVGTSTRHNGRGNMQRL